MATHDYVIANGTGAAVRSDLNDALAAIVSNNSSSTEPATTYAYQWWADTTANVLKIRNSANNAWITLRELDGTLLIEDGTASAPGIAFAADLNTGLFRPQADAVGFSAGGAERLGIGTSEVVVNNPSNDVDFRVESNNQTHMLFVDAGNDRVGIGTATVDELLHIESSDTTIRLKVESTGSNSYPGVRLTNDARTYDLQIDGATDAFRVYDATATAERMRISSSGLVGIGTSSPSRDLHVNNSSDGSFLLLTSQVNQDGLLIGARNDGNGSMVSAKGTDSHLRLFTTDSGGTESERVRINGSGRVLVGHSSDTGHGFLQVKETIAPIRDSNATTSSQNVGTINFADTRPGLYAQIKCQTDGTPGSNDYPGRIMFLTTADGASSPTERMRISANGQISLGDSAIAGNFKVFAKNSANTTTDITYYSELLSGSNNVNASHFYGITQGVAVYRLTGNGTSTFTSDERKKKNIETTRDGYLEDLRDLRVVKYNWISQDDDTPKELGLIAQEVEKVFPGLVMEDVQMEGDDYKVKTLKGSVLPFMLLKALQEAAEKIETLETKVAALEAG